MTTLRYRILGPLSVTAREQSVAVTAGRDRIVLAMLLLRPGRIVGLGELTEAVWGADPPVTAKGQLQTCVSRLRRALPPDAILTDRAGYGIRVGPDDLDAVVFTRLVEQARGADDPETARRAYRKGLDLWRGAACAEIDALVVRQMAAALDERHALAIEDWVDLELAAGRAREVLGELSEQVQRFPLRERLRGQLMTALHRSGRQADALAEYRRAREVLAEELGIEPGKELQELHRGILAGDGAPVEAMAPGRCLPRTVGDFTGREELVERLRTAIRTGPPLVVIDGMAGSGKTTLALHLAGLVGADYPDDHLYIDLQGHSEHAPIDAGEALLILLRQLGVESGRIPADPVGRLGLWRTEAGRRRLMVVLDNAATSAQVADLLPAGASSLALVTSRRRLSGLDGVHSVSLPLLDADEATDLLARIAGDRIEAEPEAAAELARRCGGLPLAIRLAGARLAHRSRWRVADLVERLGATTLPALAVESRTVASAFALSYGQLSAAAQRLFRLLGVFPGSSIDAPAVAALAGLGLAAAGDLLDELVDTHLLEEPEVGVYRMHDLLREYAAVLAGDLTEEERGQAVLGVLNLEVQALGAGVEASAVAARSLRRDLRDVPDLRPDLLAAIADPEARMERHRPDFAAYQDAAVRSGHPAYAWWIPRAAWYLLFYRGYTEDVATLHTRGMAVAREEGDDVGVALMANYVASAHYRNGDYHQARQHLRIAVQMWERCGYHYAIATCRANLASLAIVTSRFQDAIEEAGQALRLGPLVRRALAESTAASSMLPLALLRVGRYEESLRADRLRLLGGLTPHDPHQVAGALLAIQRSKRKLGITSPAMAERFVRVSLALILRKGIAYLEAEARTELGTVLAEQSRFTEAVAEHRRAVEIAEQVSASRLAAETLHDYAATLFRSGDVEAAREVYQRSLELARTWRQPYSIARALAGIAACDPGREQELLTEALGMFERMGVPERFEVARRLERGRMDR